LNHFVNICVCILTISQIIAKQLILTQLSIFVNCKKPNRIIYSIIQSMKNNRLKLTEALLVILVWIVLLAAPMFFRNDFLSWESFIGPIQILIPLFIIFLINRFVLVPRLLLKKKNILYLASVAGLIAVFSIGTFFFRPSRERRLPRDQETRQIRTLPPERRPNNLPPPHPVRNGRQIPPYANLMIFSFLLVGFDTGLMTTFRLTKSERKRAKLEKEYAETQLAFLRNQVSPHFFMNTLNNIHSLIDIDTDEAKESVIRLSKLMRHLLYDSEIEKIPIHKEIEFIKNYVDLMKLRYSDKVKISLNFPAQFPDKAIPPLLFTSFLENAFKHGISYQSTSFIKIAFTTSSESLSFSIKNSNLHSKKGIESTGIGIKNARKRLDLIYGDRYSLDIKDANDEFQVLLSIPL